MDNAATEGGVVELDKYPPMLDVYPIRCLVCEIGIAARVGVDNVGNPVFALRDRRVVQFPRSIGAVCPKCGRARAI